MSKLKILLNLLIIILICNVTGAMKERKNYGALLELEGKIWHGAGQAGTTGFDGFENYWNIAPKNQRPNLFMDYYDTWNMNEKWSHELKQELLRYHRQGYYVVAQFGINIFYLWKQYIDGSQDDELDNLVKGLKYLAIPCFIRVGYEWNNYPKEPWLLPEYTSEQLIQVFKKICGKIKEANLEMALVWNMSLSGWLANDRNMMDYWPGKEYMDWMGFNAFGSDIAGGAHAVTIAMCRNADSLGLPVMIGEASPNAVNSPSNHANWNVFFEPHFFMLNEQPSIKQMCYINWDWDGQDMVGGNGLFPWGDSRLQNPGSVKNKWFQEMADKKFLHACSEKETRSYFGYNDDQAPNSVKIKRDGKYIVWDAVNDNGEAGMAHYTIYKDGKLWDYIIDPKYPVRDLYNGDHANVEVTAMDRAGNESGKSNKLKVDLDKTYELLWDGGFNYPATSVAVDWRWMGTMDGGAKTPPDDIYIDTTGKITGKYSCWFPTAQEQVGDNYNWWRHKPKDNAKDWMVQLFQCFQVQANEKYTIRFKAVAEEPRTIKVAFMDHHFNPDHKFIPSNGTGYPSWGEGEGQWQYYKTWTADITTEVKSFEFEHTVKETECARLSLMFGTVEPTQMWFDDMSVIAGTGPNPAIDNIFLQNNKLLDFSILTRKNQKYARINYTLPQKSDVTITVYNSKGRLINSRVHKIQSQGTHNELWNLSRTPSGVYYVKIKACNRIGIRDVVITN